MTKFSIRSAHGLVNLFILFNLFIATSSLSLRGNGKLPYGNQKFGIDLDGGTFVKDGKPFRYIAGQMEYFRIHPSLWNDRLMRARHMGLNAVQVYVPWNFHEEIPGVIDFVSAEKNLVNFLKLAHHNELYVLLRIGPYVCAEWEFGGIPWWLRKTADIRVRSNDERFTQPAEKFLNELLTQIYDQLYVNADDGPILMLQIENEYGSVKVCDKEYMAGLRDLVHSKVGGEVVLYTTDGTPKDYLECGTVEGVFPTVDFGKASRDSVRQYFENQQSVSHGGPRVNSEFYTMWFAQWGLKTTQDSRQTVDEVLNTMDYMNEQNASFTFYMAHGGTNFAFWSGAENNGPVITSYDYYAPIDEAGGITPLYSAIRTWINDLSDWPQKPLDEPANLTAIAIDNIPTSRVGDLMSVVENLIAERDDCMSSEKPLSFESFAKPYTFILYTTTLPEEEEGGEDGEENILEVEKMNDIGYVYLDNVFQGVLSRLCHLPDNHREWCLKSIKLNEGDDEEKGLNNARQLKILVENSARETYPLEAQLFNSQTKGILSDVKLNGKVLTHWKQCGISFERLAEVDSGELIAATSLFTSTDESGRSLEQSKISSFSSSDADDEPAVYLGKFTSELFNNPNQYFTYFNASKWAKGFVTVNGNNLGRYWSTLGPQYTLFAPGPVFEKENKVFVVELTGHSKSPKPKTARPMSAPTDASIQFIDHPIIK